MIIALVGHKTIQIDEKIKEKIETVLRNTIKNNEVTFYYGGYSQFGALCVDIIQRLKQSNNKIKIYFITPYIYKSYLERYSLGIRYDDIIYPPLENIPKRLAIIKRNEYMVSVADIVICYLQYSFGGAYNAIEYAKRKKKKIINIAEYKM